MKIIKKIIGRIFIWVNWKRFHKSMKDVIGYESLDTLNFDLNNLELEIRNANEIPVDQEITWDNSKKTKRERFARYITLKHFSQTGELWSFSQKELDKYIN